MILIVPGTDEQMSQGHLRKMVIHTLPFGIGALASILERDRIPVAVINDGISQVTPALLRDLASRQPGRPVFGLTSLTLQAQRAKEIHALIRSTLPDAAVIVGGIHASALPEEFLDAGFEHVFLGEADTVITELATRLAANRDIRDMPGVVWKDASGAVMRNPPAPLADLAGLPPFPYHLFQDDLAHYDLGAVQSSRGCPYSCIFCSQRSITGLRYRVRPVDQVLDELGMVIDRFGIDFVTFFDDNFVVNRQRVEELCRGLIGRGYSGRVRFMCQMRGDAAAPEVLDLLKEAGFTALSFGIETGSERIAALIRKGETVAQNAAAVRLAHGRGFTTLGTFIIGFPTESDEDRRQTLELALSLPLDVMRVNIAIPYPGTPFYEMVRERITVSPGWANFNVVSPLVTGPFRKQPLPYIPDGTDEDRLRGQMLWTNLRFWLRPAGLASFFFRKSTFVTRLPSRWYLQPAFLWSVANVGLTTLFNLLWVAWTALRRSLSGARPRSSA
jgi:radical SAM superfamily enzyme YgiQ (UPF0313 family)